MRHLSYAQIPRRTVGLVNLDNAFEVVSAQVREAAAQAAAQLERLGIRHALAGGLAVGAHGYARATKDVDFLVGDEAFETHGSLVTFKSGVPIQVGGVMVDYLSPTALGPHLFQALDSPVKSAGIPIVPMEALIAMKLIAHRRQDKLDIVKLLEAGADETKIRDYLEQNAPDLIPGFDRLAAEAGNE